MIKASDYYASIEIHIPPPTARDLEMREAAATMGRHHRFDGRQICREAGLKIEPCATIWIGTRGGFSEPITFGGGPLDELLPGEAEWLAEREKAEAKP